jgi:ADP-ribose pyrophosphatase
METCMSSSRVYDGRVLNLRVDQITLRNGGTATREVVEHRGAAAIVPILQERSIVLIRQYRYAIATDLLEVPAGTIEPGEEPEHCAMRELEEETGYRSRQIQKIMEFYPVPGYGTEKIHVYLAMNLVKSEMRTEEDEQINLEILSLDNAIEKVRSGRIRDAKSICALYRAAELF